MKPIKERCCIAIFKGIMILCFIGMAYVVVDLLEQVEFNYTEEKVCARYPYSDIDCYIHNHNVRKRNK